MEIYIAKNKQRMGPYPIHELAQMQSIGLVKDYDLYWHEGMTDWAPLAALGICTNNQSKIPPKSPTLTPRNNPSKTGVVESIFSLIVVSAGFGILVLFLWAMAQSNGSSHGTSGSKSTRIIYVPRIKR